MRYSIFLKGWLLALMLFFISGITYSAPIPFDSKKTSYQKDIKVMISPHILNYVEPDSLIEQPASYHHRLSISYLNGSISDGLAIEYTYQYQYQKLIVGAGTGLNNFLGDESNNLIPLFLETGIQLKDSNTHPYLAIKSGYSFIIGRNEGDFISRNGGWMLSGRVGIRTVKKSFIVDVYAGYRQQNSDYLYNIWNGEALDEYLFRRAEFGLGLMF